MGDLVVLFWGAGDHRYALVQMGAAWEVHTLIREREGLRRRMSAESAAVLLAGLSLHAIHGSCDQGAQESNAERQSPASSGRSILLVEDDGDARELLAFALTAAGAQVTTAGNGVEGLQAAEAHRPDLVITDVAMPRMDGIEMVRRLRQRDTTKDVPMVAVTGHAIGRIPEQAREAGCTDVLLKPCHLDVFLARVNHYVGRRHEDRAPGETSAPYTGTNRRQH